MNEIAYVLKRGQAGLNHLPSTAGHRSSRMSSVMPDVLSVACHRNTLYTQHQDERVGLNVMGLAWFCEMLLGVEDLIVTATSWLSPFMTEYVNVSVLRCSVCAILMAHCCSLQVQESFNSLPGYCKKKINGFCTWEKL